MKVFNSFNEVFPFRNNRRITCGSVGTVMNVDLSDQDDLPKETGGAREDTLMSLCGEAMNLLGVLGVATESLVLDYQERMQRESSSDNEPVSPILKDDFFAEDYDGEYEEDEEPLTAEDLLDYEEDGTEDDDLESDDDSPDIFSAIDEDQQNEEDADDDYEDEHQDSEGSAGLTVTRKEQEMSDFLQSFREGMVSETGKRIYPELVGKIHQIRKKIIDGYKNVWKLYNTGALGKTATTVEKRVAQYVNPLNTAQAILLSTELAQPFFMGKNAFTKINPEECGLPAKVTAIVSGKNGGTKDEVINLVKETALKALDKSAAEAVKKSDHNDNVYLSCRK